MSPWIVGFALFNVWPLLNSLYFSLCDYSVLNPPVFIGTAHYQDMLSDAAFKKSLTNTLFYAAMALPLGMIVALALALLLHGDFRGRYVFRAIIFLPSLVPLVAMALLMQGMFNGDYGVLNWVLNLFGLSVMGQFGVERLALFLNDPERDGEDPKTIIANIRPLLIEQCYERPFIKRLPEDLRAGIAAQGLRNSHLIAIAPTGTISLLANNISSGVEPVFDLEYRRRIRGSDGLYAWYELQDYSVRLWRRVNGDDPLPACFVSAHALSPEDHLAMQAALQPYVDNAISKTINLPPEYDFEAMRSLYQRAYRAGLKGCTIFRSGPAGSGVLRDSESREQPPGPHCCGLDREGS